MSPWIASLRRLLQTPGFVALAVGTIAIGIAANTTVFTMVNTMHLRPVDYPDGGRLVVLGETSATELCAGCSVGTSAPSLRDWRQAHAFAALAAYRVDAAALAGGGAPQRVTVTAATANLLTVLGRTPIAGHWFAGPAGDAEIVLGHHLWQQQFGGDAAVIGRTVRLNGRPYTVAGVLPPGERFPDVSDAWTRLPDPVPGEDRTARDLGVVGRLAPGVSIAQANAELRVRAAALGREHAAMRQWSIEVLTLQEARSRFVGHLFVALLCAVGVVLAIVCVNLAGLMLARGARRERELAIRAALGASGATLAAEVLRESLIVAVAGGALGLLLSVWGVDAAVAGVRESLPGDVPFPLDWRVFAFCALVSVGAAFGFGLVPAVQAARPRIQETLTSGSTTVAGPRRSTTGLRALFLVVEMALSLALVATGAIVLKTAARLAAPPAVLDLDHVVSASLRLLDARFADRTRLAPQVQRVIEAVTTRTGATTAIWGFTFLTGFGGSEQQIAVDGQAALPAGASPSFAFSVTPDYFAVIHLPVRSGRAFTAADGAGQEPVAIVNEQMAARLWPDGSAIGRRVRLAPIAGEPWRTVVGVVGNENEPVRPEQAPPPFVYVPYPQLPVADLFLRARTPGPPGPLMRALPAIVAGVDPDQPVEHVRLAIDEHRARFAFVYWTGQLLGIFAGIALLLSAIGLYGAASHLVSDRRRELGVRAALGASRSDLRGLVLGRGLRLAAAAIVIGLPLAIGAAAVLRSVLYASPIDPLVYAGAAVALTAVVVLAFWLPARRASRVDPLVVLRTP